MKNTSERSFYRCCSAVVGGNNTATLAAEASRSAVAIVTDITVYVLASVSVSELAVIASTIYSLRWLYERAS